MYLAELELQQQKAKVAGKRPSLPETWAQELVSRAAYDLTVPGLPRDVRRLEKVSNMLRDFYKAIASFGEVNPPKRATRWNSLPLYNKYVPLPQDPGFDLVLPDTCASRILYYTFEVRPLQYAPATAFVSRIKSPWRFGRLDQ